MHYTQVIYSKYHQSNRTAFLHGLSVGLPIGLGYLVVSFSIGLAAKNAGLNIVQGVVASLLTNASAGQYAVFSQIAAGASLTEIAFITLIANARYLLMSCALSQHIGNVGIVHRLLLGTDLTDEVFGVSITCSKNYSPYFSYGAMIASMPFWAIGTGLGIWIGSLLPICYISALTVSLYGMFLAIIIPPARKNHAIRNVVFFSFIFSSLSDFLPLISSFSSGSKIILLTVLISSVAAIKAPILPYNREE